MLYLTIIIVSLILSFFFSGSETAFVSVNKVRVELWRRRNRNGAELIHKFIQHPEKFLYTTLVGNNIFNVAFATFATFYFSNYVGPQITWLAIVLATLLIGEIIPKTAFRSLADLVVGKIVYPLEFFYRLFWPITWLLRRISEIILSLLGMPSAEAGSIFSKKDIEHLLSESTVMGKEDSPQDAETNETSDLLQGILRMKELWVRDAMVPRPQIAAVEDTVSVAKLLALFKKEGLTKIPVFHDTLDDITGVVFLKDLILKEISGEKVTISELLRKIMFVPETKRCSELLSDFRNKKETIAIVIDEHGGTAGLITTEDLIEELVGDIEDEFDEQEELIRRLDEKTFSVSAHIEIEKLNEVLKLGLPEGDYETLAGFLISQLGNIPGRDTRVKFDAFLFTITRATRRRVESVKVELPAPLSGPDQPEV